MGVKHMKLANGIRGAADVAARSEVSEICFVDYSQCPSSDLCWILDAGCGCEQHDNCFVDTG